jgi:hypothetical protein
MREIIFEMDTLPLSLNPLKCNDYIGRQILCSIYERLIINYNCMLKIRKNLYTLELLFPNISVDYYIETIQYHKNLKNNSKYFRFFKGVKLKKITEKKIVFFINSEFPYDFKEILQSLFFIPSKSNIPINNGPYSLIKKTKYKIILSPNQNYWNKQNIQQFNIIFILNKNSKKTYQLYKENKIMISSNTHFNYNLFSKKDIQQDINIINSNLIFMFEIKNVELKKYIINNLKILKENTELKKLLNFVELKKNKEVKNIKVEAIKIIYSDFYPNEIIVNELKNILKNIKIEMIKISDFKSFVLINKEEYDIILHLITPSLKDIRSLGNSKSYLNEINFLNSIAESTKYIPFAKGKSIFLKRKEIKLIMDSLGQIRYELLRWED